MPNHCDSDLIVSGDPKLLDEILAKFFNEEGELNCDAVIPYPDKFKRLDEAAKKWDDEKKGWEGRPKDGFNSGGYEWCCNNWGTKWGTYDGSGVERKPRSFSVRFNSAWAPPTPVVNKLAEMYPTIKFSLDGYEQGAAYHYIGRWENGVQTRDEELSYRGGRGG
jgi:hypothetical protein